MQGVQQKDGARGPDGALIEDAKRAHWEEFLSSLDEKTVWNTQKYVSGEPTDGGKVRIPILKAK